MRYVIVSVIKGDAGKFNEDLRRKIFNEFKAKSSKLPAHITLKSPFEYDGDIKELEEHIKSFCENNYKENININGYDHFDDRVIYMKVDESKVIRELHYRFVDKIKDIEYINFGRLEGKNAIFHITLSSKKISKVFKELWNYLIEIPCDFTEKLDNISIYKWEDNTWILHKEFKLMSKIR